MLFPRGSIEESFPDKQPRCDIGLPTVRSQLPDSGDRGRIWEPIRQGTLSQSFGLGLALDAIPTRGHVRRSSTCRPVGGLLPPRTAYTSRPMSCRLLTSAKRYLCCRDHRPWLGLYRSRSVLTDVGPEQATERRRADDCWAVLPRTCAGIRSCLATMGLVGSILHRLAYTTSVSPVARTRPPESTGDSVIGGNVSPPRQKCCSVSSERPRLQRQIYDDLF